MRAPSRAAVPVVALLLAWPFASSGAQRADNPSFFNIRPLNDAAEELLRVSTERCPTIDRLGRYLETSNVVVYLTVMPLLDYDTGATRFMSSAGGTRYLAIDVNSMNDTWSVVGWLAHELQHAVELAENPDVVDAETMAALYRKIGWPVSDTEWETDEAVRVGHEAQLEYAAWSGAPAQGAAW
jgi:hypothetical protein